MTRRRFLLDLTMAAAGLAAAALWASRREGRSCDPPEPEAPTLGVVEVPPAAPTPSPSPTPEEMPLDGDVAY